jgi:hypothetical protein
MKRSTRISYTIIAAILGLAALAVVVFNVIPGTR